MISDEIFKISLRIFSLFDLINCNNLNNHIETHVKLISAMFGRNQVLDSFEAIVANAHPTITKSHLEPMAQSND